MRRVGNRGGQGCVKEGDIRALDWEGVRGETSRFESVGGLAMVDSIPPATADAAARADSLEAWHMAVRTGTGTGVIVSLVVFVLTTVFLLVLTIVFFAGQADALEQSAQAKAALSDYVRPQQQSNDVYRRIEQEAKQNGQSVAAYLNVKYDNLMRYVNGETVRLPQLKSELARYGVDEQDGVVRDVLDGASRDLADRDAQIEGLEGKLAERDDELARKDGEIAQMKEDHKQALEEVGAQIEEYRRMAEQYRQEVQETMGDMSRAVDAIRDEFQGREAQLEDELDGVSQELYLLRDRVNEYEEILNRTRIKGERPELLVDARVIDVEARNDQVYVNRGKKDRIVLGMTFEVYDDETSIGVDQLTGLLTRGKASVQVVKVGESTSTCKITRAVRGRPVVPNDVLANAIYDPEYTFKFLVHGKFDVDGDDRPSEAEAEYLRSLVVDWGGEIVLGEELPGDLDFLVLGEKPPMPPPAPPDAPAAQLEVWVRQREAVKKYEDLFEDASEAQIPVLNANRFFILIGHTNR